MIERGTRLISETGRAWEHDGADGLAFGLARQTDDLDLAIAMTERLIQVKAGPGGDDPFNYVMLSGLQVFRGDWTPRLGECGGGREGYAREGADVFPSWRCVASRSWRPMTAGREARRLATEGLRTAIERATSPSRVYLRQILGFVALSSGATPDRRRGAGPLAADPGR